MHHLATLLLAAAALPLAAQNTGIALTNGVDGYLEIPYSAAVVPQSGITVEAWLTYDDATLPTGWRYPTVVRQNIAPQQEALFLRINADNIGARVLRWKVVMSSGAQVFCSWTFASGQLANWTHVAATWDGANAALYVNGAPVATAAGSGPIWDRGGVLRIGKGDDSGGPIEVWNGQLDEVRLWPFARTQAEIQQTMNSQLFSVPGRVSTWNLDNHTLDTSGTLHATSSGTMTFAANPLALALLPGPSGFSIGASTPGCLGPLQTTFGSLPQAGNAAFAPVCTRAPGGALTFLAMAFGVAGSPLQVGGIAYWLDLGSSVLVVTTANGLGAARFPVALPAWLRPGFAVAFQYGFADTCGPQGLTASDALLVVTQ
jgi:hypothetical protein